MTSVACRVYLRDDPISGDPTATRAWKLFVRLPPQAAVRLRDLAIQKWRRPDISGQGWSLPPNASAVKASTRCNSGVEFLPLAITSLENSFNPIYVSYNGGDLDVDEGGGRLPSWIIEYRLQAKDRIGFCVWTPEFKWNCIEIPSSFLPAPCSQVLVEALPFVGDAATLEVEPVTIEDWSLLRLHADWLESGGLLSQISLVYPDQVISLRVGGLDMARIRVSKTNFTQKMDFWSPSKRSEKAPDCLRLVADTQVSIVPRGKEPPLGGSASLLQPYPTLEDYGESTVRLAHLVRVPLLSVECNESYVSESMYDRILSGSQQLCYAHVYRHQPGQPNVQHSSALVRLKASPHVPDGFIAVHYCIRVVVGVGFGDKVLSLVPTSSQEIEESARYVARLVQTGEASLSIQRLQPHVRRNREAWRYPFGYEPISMVSKIAASSDFEYSIVTEHLHSLGKEPIVVGGIFQINCSMSSQSRFYRLELQFEMQRNAKSREGLLCVIAQDIPTLLRDCYTQTGNSGTESVLSIGESQLQLPAKFDLLPSRTILPISLLSILPEYSDQPLIFFGSFGSGRTTASLIAATFAHLLSHGTTCFLDCRHLRMSRRIRMHDLLGELSKTFHDVSKTESSTLVLDNLDELMSETESDGNILDSSSVRQLNPVGLDQSKLLADALKYLWKASLSRGRNIKIIVTCKDPGFLPPEILALSGFRRAISVPDLSAAERRELFFHSVQSTMRSDFADHFAESFDGYSPADIKRLSARVSKLLQQHPLLDVSEAVAQQKKAYVPSIQAEAIVEEGSHAKWGEIGGLFKAKADIEASIVRPGKYKRIFQHSPIELPRGVLLLGPSGCGKSLLVPALAKECGFSLVTCRGPELLDKYIGASEAKVRELFARAHKAAPSILFIDELDSLAPRRGSDHTGVTDRVVNQLLTLLDGVENKGGDELVFIVAATSRPDSIDPALLRPGRLEKHIYVGYPETVEEWIDLILSIAAGYLVEPDTLQDIKQGFYTQFVQLFHCPLSPADVQATFSTAYLSAVHEAIEAGRVEESIRIKSSHLVQAFMSAKPSLSREDYSRLLLLFSRYIKDSASQQKLKAADVEVVPSTNSDQILRVALK